MNVRIIHLVRKAYSRKSGDGRDFSEKGQRKVENEQNI